MSESILYVDDDRDDHEIFVEVVNSINPTTIVYCTEEAKMALALLRKLPILPQLIFLDMNMPMMNGLDFLREVRNESKFESIRIVVFTTSLRRQDEQECLRLGATDYIVKPSSFSSMQEELLKFISPLST